MMSHWLLKTEPEAWSWDDQKRDGVTPWDGVRNYQASRNMQAMSLGDLCLFYHSGKEKRVVGIVKVIRTFYVDLGDLPFGRVDVEKVHSLPRPVALAEIKADTRLSHLALVRQSRLSVMPIDEPSWNLILSFSQ